MGIFYGRLDLLLMFIAQVVQILLGILIYIRVSEMTHRGKHSSASVFSKSGSVHRRAIATAKFSRLLHRKRRK